MYTLEKKIFKLREYVECEFTNIPGWCLPNTWRIIEAIFYCNDKYEDSGPVAEIGPYYGKFFWGLVKSSGSDAKHLAIDIFDEEENMDNSGVLGDKKKFLNYGKINGNHEEKIKIISKNSITLSARTIISEFGDNFAKFSFFSVDGCHLKEFVKHDIKIATKLTHEFGTIIIDDYGNPRWHGVQEAVAEIYLLDKSDFVPFVYGYNKLFLCHSERLKTMCDRMKCYFNKNFKEVKIFETDRFGYLGLTLL